MFSLCKLLTSINISNFNIQNVEYIDGLFKDCHKLLSINISNFNTKNVKSMSWMFGVV